jgi:DNA-binding LytR/AlgR family response regulator
MPLSTTRIRPIAPDITDEPEVRAGLQRANGGAAANEWISRGILLVGEREHRLYIFEPDKIDYIESHGNYVKFHVSSADYISRDSIKRLSHVLADSGFIRIERSLLLNVHAISYAERTGRGCYSFTLTSGSCLRSGATYRNTILQVLPLTQIHGGHPFVSR